ncbi:glutamate binding protein [Dacryopinax primogenitus]|uniref:Glutamate binding protein n=1 Tax=Dacryopinax primogenitus (strain DJM 731) TaxID=1858805 RepID=M5G6I1_DACPD|nr:glutamate binding protein [Dacryopinax primogenitus]EJU04304.1 glutamate binding protein [Dacryopinax primogenitus]
MSSYPVPPPSYQAPPSPSKNYGAADETQQALLGEGVATTSTAARNAIFDQPAADDLPDDFKYGTTVSESAVEIQQAFVRKVYSILFVQILGTVIVAAGMRTEDAMFFVKQHPSVVIVPLFGTLINLGVLFWKRHSHPLNLVLLATFTLMESVAIGAAVAYYDQVVVMQALLITLGVFLGLTLFTLQSKYNFDSMGPFLFAGLLVLVFSGLVHIFLPFSRGVDLAYGIGGALLFSGYIVYDTHLINRRLSPDEYIWGAIALYLDFINLFLSILRILNNANHD